MTQGPQGPDRAPRVPGTRRKRLLQKINFRLLRRLLLYHSALAAVLLLASLSFPGFIDYLPVGGVSNLIQDEAGVALNAASADLSAGTEPLDSVRKAGSGFDRLGYARRLIIVLIGTWLLMLPVSWVHKGVHRISAYDHSLDETVLVLPGIIAAIVLVVQHSLALAFSLAGIVAGVQFRRALQDTFDVLFILVAIGSGIAAGVGALEIAAVLTVFFTYATFYVYYLGDGFESDFIARKKIIKRMHKQADANDRAKNGRPGQA
ncbi:MAG: DUF4956 domain-containing protein [Pseudomonadota bacterium]|nr:DUF4956 domain-containing protein [Pseudomonadota bacterium]